MSSIHQPQGLIFYGSLADGKVDAEADALSSDAFGNRRFASVQLCDAPHNRQSEAGARNRFRSLRSIETFKDSFAFGFRYSGTVVADTDRGFRILDQVSIRISPPSGV